MKKLWAVQKGILIAGMITSAVPPFTNLRLDKHSVTACITDILIACIISCVGAGAFVCALRCSHKPVIQAPRCWTVQLVTLGVSVLMTGISMYILRIWMMEELSIEFGFVYILTISMYWMFFFLIVVIVD